MAPLLSAGSAKRIAVAHLDSRQALIALTVEQAGASDEIQVPVRSIAASAVHFGSAALVIGHSHPRGDPTPSAADIESTRALAAALKPLGIRLFDHLIFAAGSWRSFRSDGLL